MSDQARQGVGGARWTPPIGKAPARQSLRTRLAIWNAAVVILTAVATLVMLREGVTQALYTEIDVILGEDRNEIELMLTQMPDRDFNLLKTELERKAEGHEQHGWFVELRGANGQLIWSSSKDDDRPVDFHQNPSSPFRVLSPKRVDPNDYGVESIVVGSNLKLLRSDLSRIDELVVLTASLIFAITPLFAYWLAGRATNAVGEITRSASRLRPDRLEERLPLRGTGDELDQLALTINGLLDRIAVFLDQKRDVLANAAHELRTPLAAIRSSVEVALNEERTPPEYQEILEDIIDQSGSLQVLLNQLLLLSEAEAERLKTQVEVVEFDALVAKAMAMFQGVAEVREMTLEVERLDSSRVAGNRFHLQQLINNLIDNALKYTPVGGRVTISLATIPERHLVEFRVRDTGVGIAPEDVPRVFDRFFRVDRSRSRRDTPEGTGLGLCICQAVVEAHNGHIFCTSTLGRGTEFRVELKLLDAAERAALQRVDEEPRSHLGTPVTHASHDRRPASH